MSTLLCGETVVLLNAPECVEYVDFLAGGHAVLPQRHDLKALGHGPQDAHVATQNVELVLQHTHVRVYFPLLRFVRCFNDTYLIALKIVFLVVVFVSNLCLMLQYFQAGLYVIQTTVFYPR